MSASRVMPVLVLFLGASVAIRAGLGVVGVQAAAGDEPLATRECAAPVPEVLAAFAEREARLAAESSALEQRMVELQRSKEQLAAQLEDIRAAEAALKATLAISETASEEDIGQLVRVYENMKPRDAAALFSEMAPEFAAGFVARMQPESAALILAGLEAQKSHAISVMLAGRNARAPQE